MILVTGGTGFVGRALIRQLVMLGKPVRTLLRPSKETPNLPVGVPVEVVVCSLKDERGLRAAMKGVDVVFHLAGAERLSSKADLQGVDIEGTQMVTQVAVHAGVERFFYLSHLGADRASAYPVLKAKAIAESGIIHSGINYTIFRSAVAYGPGDQFTTSLARLLKMSPGIFLMPGDGSVMLQPIWVEDLVSCLTLALEDEKTAGQIFQIGGVDYLSFRQIATEISQTIGVRRQFVPLTPSYLRLLALWIEQTYPQFPVSIYWLDYLAADRTCAIDNLPRLFGLMPARFSQQLEYLKLLSSYQPARAR
jgi:NADH dehydrogenase